MANDNEKQARINFNLWLSKTDHEEVKKASELTGIPMTRIITMGAISCSRELMRRNKPQSMDYSNR